MTNGALFSESGSELSEAGHAPSVSSSSPVQKANDVANNRDRSLEAESHAVASEDDREYDMDTSMHEVEARQDSPHSSSDESSRAPKRKGPDASMDDGNYIRNNPSLYGLRRSHRARPSRPLMDESSEQDDSDSDVAVRPRKRPRHNSRHSSKQGTPNVDLADDMDDDSDNYGGARAKLTKKQRRRFLQSGGNLAPSHAELRFSTRKAGKVSNYNEDDGDDMFDQADSEMMTPNYWPVGQEDDRPAIDVVLNHRLRELVTEMPPSKDDFEFLIKWQQKAYYHATWETPETLANCRSVRRLENYIRKTLIEDLRVMHGSDVSPEEKEKWILDREQYIDALGDFSKVERVIGVRDGEEATEYYVKWKGLFYDQSTWESASLVSDIAQPEIDRYLNRTFQLPVSDKTESNLATRSGPQRIPEQPSYIQHGVLRDFQMTGLNFLAYNWAKGKNVVLADEMGLGKTVQTVAFINWLRHARDQQGPFIVVVPLSTMPAWADTFDAWTPDINYVIYSGKQEARNVIKEYELLVDGNVRRPRFHVLLTTYEYVLHDAAFLSQMKWQFMAVDEAHRLKNRESQLYDRLKEFKAPSRLLITGTPVQNNLGELSALFDFLMPGIVNIDEAMDLSSEAASAKIAELTEAIKPYMLRRTKQKVEKDLPPKSEKIIRVELSDIQLEYYRNILTKNYAALNQGAKGQRQSLLNIMMELKKASNHPFMFPSAEDRLVPLDARRDEMLRALITSSGKMMLLDQLLAKLKKDNHRVLIFSQMVKMLDILGDYMEARGHAYQRLDGTIAASSRRIAIDHFNAPGSTDFCFLLSTRAGGLGINLMTADTVIIFDSDWNPQADLQAMARAHRIGQVRPVSVYRLVSKDTVEEEILERARNKLMLEYLTIQQGVTDKETQARRNALVGEPGNSSEISRILKKRGQKMFDQTDNQKKLEELDLDSMLEKAEDYKVEQPEGTEADGGEEFLRSFDFVDVKVDELSWDDIIPHGQLEAVKAEEQRKADEQYLANIIEQNKPRVRNAVVEEREERQAKRHQRTQAADPASDSEDGIQADPKRPLSEREYRYLIKGHLRYGSIEDRTEEFLAEARLRGRDIDIVKTAMHEIADRAASLVKEEQERMDALGRASSRTLTKKDKKAVLFEHHGVKRINAETILERPDEMRLLQKVTTAASDPKNFRVPDATKSAGYSCNWGAREDGMLCVGIARHGYGAWEKIRDDPDLGLSDKLFLEEHRIDKRAERERQEGKNAKSPGAVHLVRRADYLISVLKGKVIGDPAAKKAVENHHRNNKKNSLQGTPNLNGSPSFSASPVPSNQKRPHQDPDKQRQRTLSHGHRDSIERPHTPRSEHRHSQGAQEDVAREKKHRHHHRKSNDYQMNGDVGGDAGDEMLRLIFRPVRESLRIIQSATKSNLPDAPARANILREHLRILGNFVKATLEDGGASLEGRLWYVFLFGE
jgi:chromodomain-helicase-DNA-binding protein 1